MNTSLNGIYNLDKINQLNIYISWKELEKENINNIKDFANDEPDAHSHIRFLEKYQQFIQGHIDSLKKAIETAKELSNNLGDFLKELDIVSFFSTKDMFEVDGIQYYVSYNQGTFSFITSIAYDPYLKKNIYASYDYRYYAKRLIDSNRNIGFTEQPIEEIRNHPFILMEEINKMDEEDSCEKVKVRFKKCEELLLTLFKVRDSLELIDYKDPCFETFFGNRPFKLLQKMHIKQRDNMIKLQLKSNGINEVTEDLISLIKVEDILKGFEEYKGMFRDKYEERKKKRINEKLSLLKSVGIDQDTLDTYMSYIQLEDE